MNCAFAIIALSWLFFCQAPAFSKDDLKPTAPSFKPPPAGLQPGHRWAASFDFGPSSEPMGNIGPYRKECLRLLGNAWPQSLPREGVTILTTIDKSGKVLSAEVLNGISDKRIQEKAIAVVRQIRFSPLPDWYRGEQLPIKLKVPPVLEPGGSKPDTQNISSQRADALSGKNSPSKNISTLDLYERECTRILSAALPPSIKRQEIYVVVLMHRTGKPQHVTIPWGINDQATQLKAIATIKEITFPPLPNVISRDVSYMRFRVPPAAVSPAPKSSDVHKQ